MAVSEVVLSIAANGYFKEEPLFVVPKLLKERDAIKQQYIVVEGNRRLAAVKLLLDTALRRAVKAIDLPELTAPEKARLSKLPVSIYPDKRSLWRQSKVSGSSRESERCASGSQSYSHYRLQG